MVSKTENEQPRTLAKHTFWGVIIAALIAGIVAIFIHFDAKQTKIEQIVTEQVGKASIDRDKKYSAWLTIKQIQLTPVAFDIPSSFYIEIENDSQFKARDITVLIDFGEAKIEKYSVKSSDKFNIMPNNNDYVLKLNVTELVPNESLYINCLISSPVFKKVLISADNIIINKKLTYTSYKDQLVQEPTSSWLYFFSILAGAFIIYVFFVIIQIINKKLELSWEI